MVSDTLTAKVTTNPGETFIDQMIKMVESSKRPKTPNEVAITMVLIGLTAIFTIIIVALLGMSVTLGLGADLSVLIALYVCPRAAPNTRAAGSATVSARSRS